MTLCKNVSLLGALWLIKSSWKINQVKVKHPLIKELRFIAERTAAKQTQTHGIRQKELRLSSGGIRLLFNF